MTINFYCAECSQQLSVQLLGPDDAIIAVDCDCGAQYVAEQKDGSTEIRRKPSKSHSFRNEVVNK